MFEEKSEEILKILKNKDIYVIEHSLRGLYKNIKNNSIDDNKDDSIDNNTHIHNNMNIHSKIKLNNSALDSLSIYIFTYLNHTHIIDTGFKNFIRNFLKKIEPESIFHFLKCVSAVLAEDDIQFYRKLFSYSKIYHLFKETIKIESSKKDKNFFHFFVAVMKLLDNKPLVHKNLKTVIGKLLEYVKNDVVDKNIVDCSVIVSAVCEYSPDLFNDSTKLSLISYFMKILYTPTNFLFLDFKDGEILEIAIQKICVHFQRKKFLDKENSKIKKTSVGLLRECIGKIQEFRFSTVYEEILVVIFMTGILTEIFKLCFEAGNRNFDFLNYDLLEISIMKSDEYGLNDKKDNIENGKKSYNIDEKNDNIENKSIDFNKSFDSTTNIKTNIKLISLDNRNYESLKDRFIISKYKFLNYLHDFVDTFDRISFYNDLSQLSFPSKLFPEIKNFLKLLDWSDLIVFACRNKELEYIRIIFDDIYICDPKHTVYLKIFLKKINSENLIYFTKFAIDKMRYSILFDIYLMCIEKEDLKTRKIRAMILKSISSNKKEEFFFNILFKEFFAKIDTKKIHEMNDQNIYKNILLLMITISTLMIDLKNDLENDLKNGIEKNVKNVKNENERVENVKNENVKNENERVENLIKKELENDRKNYHENDRENYQENEHKFFDKSFMKLFLGFLKSLLHKNNSYNGYFIVLISLFSGVDSFDTYFDIIIGFLVIRNMKKDKKEIYEKFYSKVFPKLFLMNQEEIKEIGKVSGNLGEIEDSKFVKIYEELIFLMK